MVIFITNYVLITSFCRNLRGCSSKFRLPNEIMSKMEVSEEVEADYEPPFKKIYESSDNVLNATTRPKQESLDLNEGVAAHTDEIIVPNLEVNQGTLRQRELNGQPQFLCVICEQVFQSKRELQEHFVTHNISEAITLNERIKEDPSTHCVLCKPEKWFATEESFKEHLPSHGLKIQYCCHVCNTSGQYPDFQSLREHMIDHVGDRNFHLGYHVQTPKSALTSLDMSVYKNTIKTLHAPFFCNLCSALAFERLDHHMKSVHNRYNKCCFRCHVCGEYFEREAFLRKHFKKFFIHKIKKRNGTKDDPNSSSGEGQTSNESELIYCQFCNDGSAFKNEKMYQSHLKKHNCSCGDPTCAICVLKLKPLFYCQICDKNFQNQKFLEKHSRVHETNRPRDHICPVCQKGFFDKTGLFNHTSAVHGNECYCGNCERCSGKNHKYQCQEEGCKKIFKSESKLKRHSFVHSGLRPYICERCGQGFSQCSNLAVHIRSHERRDQKKSTQDSQVEDNTDTSNSSSVSGFKIENFNHYF